MLAAADDDPGTSAPGAVLLRVAAGDRDALAALYDQVAPVVYLLARRRCATAGDAELLVQRAFEDLWRSAPAFPRQTRSAESWVVTVISASFGTERDPGPTRHFER